VKYLIAGSLLVAASSFVSEAAIGKCAHVSTSERFSDAKNVVLVAIIDAHDGSVPWPYGLEKGATIPGKLLTLRVLRSWKGSLRPEAVVHGWTPSPRIEDAYPRTAIGEQIIFFFGERSPYEIMSCNAADPDHLSEVSEELDAIAQKNGVAQTDVATD
jgi:hypothetical protein